MTDQEKIEMQGLIAGIIAQAQPAQPAKSTGYGDTQAQPQAMTSDLITVVLPFSCKRGGKWLNWTESYLIQDGAEAFNALCDRVEAKGKPLSLRGDATASGGGYGKK
jgi:hypothetical protein